MAKEKILVSIVAAAVLPGAGLSVGGYDIGFEEAARADLIRLNTHSSQ